MIFLPMGFSRPASRLAYAVYWLPYIGIYQVVNRYPVFEPRLLPLTSLDVAIPFAPALLPLYVAYLPLFWWTGVRAEDDETFLRFFYATYFQLLVSVVIWVLFPVTMSREIYYDGAAYNWADTFWRWFDAPNNCLPSLHAANGLLFIEFNWNRPARWFHTLLALGVIFSTVLVKQHYVMDLVAGSCLYLLAHWLLPHLVLIRKRPTVEPCREPSAV